MTNFPGNPFGEPYQGTISNDAAVITKAIRCLAFEQRTANQLARMDLIGEDLDDMSHDAVDEWVSEAEDVGQRLGHGQ